MQNIALARGPQFLASEIDFEFGLLAPTIASIIGVANYFNFVAKLGNAKFAI